MEYHKQIINNILDAEMLDGFKREERMDELWHLSTETLQEIINIYYKEDCEVKTKSKTIK